MEGEEDTNNVDLERCSNSSEGQSLMTRIFIMEWRRMMNGCTHTNRKEMLIPTTMRSNKAKTTKSPPSDRIIISSHSVQESIERGP